jgi:hypothetical protein
MSDADCTLTFVRGAEPHRVEYIPRDGDERGHWRIESRHDGTRWIPVGREKVTDVDIDGQIAAD